MSEPRHVADARRSRRHTAAIVCLSLAGVLALGRDHQPGPGVALLGTVWDTLSPTEQVGICHTVDTRGDRAAARELLESSNVVASIEDAEFFVHGLACHIRVELVAG